MREKKHGYLTISRKLFDSDFWSEKRIYSRAEAMVDLIQLAAFDNNSTLTYRGKVVGWERGQLVASVRYLAQRWGWSNDKVFSFLELLRTRQTIRTDCSQGINVITLINYNQYNSKKNTSERTAERETEHLNSVGEGVSENHPNARRTHSRTRAERTPNEIKELKELKEKREAREKFFYDSLTPYLNKYGAGMLRAFYNHWSEWNNSGAKMKWELQETWEIGKRLATWAGREREFSGKKTTALPKPKMKTI